MELFDKKIKEVLSNDSQEQIPNFLNWEEMETGIMDKMEDKKDRGIFFLIATVLLISSISFLFYQHVSNDSHANHQTLASTPSITNPTTTLSLDHSLKLNNKLATNNKLNTDSNISGKKSNEALNLDQNIAKFNPNKSNNNITKQNSYRSKTKNVISDLKQQGITQQSNFRNITKTFTTLATSNNQSIIPVEIQFNTKDIYNTNKT